MKALVIGGGGREHALAWKLEQSPDVTEVIVAPGNAGTATATGMRNASVAADDLDGLLSLAQQEQVGFVMVGPEAPLVAGVVDKFQAAGIPCFGPSAAAAQLEGSKAFSKSFLARHQIPTAAFETFSELSAAQSYIREHGAPIVVKADGLAAGKGVVVAQTETEALAAVEDMLAGNRFGDAGARVVLEDFLAGEEASFICLCDGQNAVPFASSQDHKPIHDGDRGPNTGGMGAYSPAPVVDAQVHEKVMTRIVEPTLAGMAAEGAPYVGFLYVGLMINDDGDPLVIEFNCRFGDPEAQPIMMRLQTDLLSACQASLAGDLAGVTLEFDERSALGVVMAAGGYPGDYATGEPITGLGKELVDTKVFHAGTRLDGEQVVTSGGRVLCVVGMGRSVANAQARAYARIEQIGWRNRYFRQDIGFRALQREAAEADE